MSAYACVFRRVCVCVCVCVCVWECVCMCVWPEKRTYARVTSIHVCVPRPWLRACLPLSISLSLSLSLSIRPAVTSARRVRVWSAGRTFAKRKIRGRRRAIASILRRFSRLWLNYDDCFFPIVNSMSGLCQDGRLIRAFRSQQNFAGVKETASRHQMTSSREDWVSSNHVWWVTVTWALFSLLCPPPVLSLPLSELSTV